MTATVGATAPGMAAFLLAVLIATPIVSGVIGALIERRYISPGASARPRCERTGTGRVPGCSPYRSNHLNN